MKLYHKPHPSHALAGSFLTLILLGTVILLLPWSSKSGHVHFLDALFTATSATCVTGLTVLDTGTDWTLLGKLVILGLIQLGGLGIMTFSTFFAYVFSRKLSIRNRVLIERSIAGGPMPQLGKLLLMIIGGTIFIEAIGAIILTIRFSSDYSLQKSIFLGIFHSISAFCNAGFSLFSTSLIAYKQDPVINITVILLIIIGGLGFWVLFDLKNLFSKKRTSSVLSFHSKIVLTQSSVLVAAGFFALFFFEWNNTMHDLSLSGKFLASLFQSTTARTAGFNTIDISSLTNGSILVLIILMLIGASPGSCGGGIKTTTFTVLMAMNFSRLRDERQVRLFNRGIPESIISKSLGIAFFWLIAVTIASLVLLIIEHPAIPKMQGRAFFLDVIFESFSAIGTVGLSMGITPLLSGLGKIIIIILMYIGRIGPVTMALAIAGTKPARYKYAEESFLVG